MARGPLIIVSGPSGSGKSTLIARVIEKSSYPLRLAVSATTRTRRPGERDGVDYHFWNLDRFQQQRSAGAFLEYAQVHGQHYYGTPKSEIAALDKGTGVILDIDVQGAEQVRRSYPASMSVFVVLPSWEMYEQRLRKRGTETEASIARRLETARSELARKDEYQHVIVNDDLETAANEFLELIEERISKGGSSDAR
jgi:guanylate kinase